MLLYAVFPETVLLVLESKYTPHQLLLGVLLRICPLVTLNNLIHALFQLFGKFETVQFSILK